MDLLCTCGLGQVPKEIPFVCTPCLVIYISMAAISGYMFFQELYRYIHQTTSYKTSDNKILLAVKEKLLIPLQKIYKASLAKVHEFFIDIHGGKTKNALNYCALQLTISLVDLPGIYNYAPMDLYLNTCITEIMRDHSVPR